MTKTVCIVGAGPSGLVAAKALLHDAAPGSFKVTIYDAQTRIGGLWPTRKDDSDGQVHPLMVTNQSRHTVQFSDLAWRESDPQFPRAWQVGQYLERYAKRYGGADMRLDHKVVSAELQDGGSWKVKTESTKGQETSVFDYLLVATGYFGKPTWPDYIPTKGDVPIIHSSKYRDVKSLLANSKSRGGKILVVGGQMSGTEIAGTVATHLSSIVNSPGEKVIENSEKYSIQHVTHRPTWVCPLFTSPKPDSAAPPFAPCDLPSYNLALRQKPLWNSQGYVGPDVARVYNNIFRAVLGTDQSEFSPETAVGEDWFETQPFIAMSNYYLDFVRSGLIQVSKGRLASISGTRATISPSNQEITDIVAVILATGFDPSPSLSFLPPAVLSSLSHSPSTPDLPLSLAFHGTHHPSLPTLGFVGFYRSPYWGVMEMQARFLAHLWSTTSSQPPELKQALEKDDSIARTESLRTESLRTDPRTSQFPMGDYAWLMQEFSRALQIPISAPPPANVGADESTTTTPVLVNGRPMDILTPARYISPTATPEQRDEARRSLEMTRDAAVSALTGGRFVAGAVFRSLLGEWRLERDLVSKLPSHPSGRFVGTAKFLLREGTADGREDIGGGGEDGNNSGRDLGMEYLYVEDGEFVARDNPALRFRATRRYVWRYDEARDRLSVWFARTDDGGMRADYLFHELEFFLAPSPPPPPSAPPPSSSSSSSSPTSPTAAKQEQEEERKKEVSSPGSSSSSTREAAEGRNVDKGKRQWRARASHLCSEDMYDVDYEFGFRGVNLREWRLGYGVKGPKKDYGIDGVYTRV
ncbi:FAD/NAD(P)-binding domain-containing protein [Xylariomycetidae sp. FL2044]|nr:FAD/NAD(P)-binding domain-containing protein [Xylariomycetidae sp. FL2044]